MRMKRSYQAGLEDAEITFVDDDGNEITVEEAADGASGED